MQTSAYILVRVNEDVLDNVQVAREIEKIEGVHSAVIVRSTALRYPEDKYVMSAYTTDLAKIKLETERQKAPAGTP